MHEQALRWHERVLGLDLPLDMRLFYAQFDGQAPLAADGVVAGLRWLSLHEVVTVSLDQQRHHRGCAQEVTRRRTRRVDPLQSLDSSEEERGAGGGGGGG